MLCCYAQILNIFYLKTSDNNGKTFIQNWRDSTPLVNCFQIYAILLCPDIKYFLPKDVS